MSIMRTSENSPLKIAELERYDGLIGLTLCPGKKGDSLFGGRWDRNLQTDLQRILEWGAVAIVSLIEDHEFDLLKVQDLAENTENAGLEWYHLPIPDVGVPGEEFEARWLYVGHRLRAHLRAGRKVLLHCRGGLGRTGIVAARMLVEDGVSAGDAMERVRAVRPGAIETRAQEDYVASCASLTIDDARLGRVLGCVLGGAVGDGFGYAVEFDRWSAIQERFGPNGLQEPVLSGGRLVVSDDTQMTLFTLEGLANGLQQGGGRDAIRESIRQAYLSWNKTQSGPERPSSTTANVGLLAASEMYARRAPGNTCLSACAAGANGSPEHPINNSKGCGGVMRTAPIGLPQSMTSREAFKLGAYAGAVTHGHPSGYLSAGWIAALVGALIAGAPLDEAIETVQALARTWPGHEETVTAVEGAVRLASSGEVAGVATVRQLGEGWVGEEALGIGLYAVLISDTFEQAMRVAANHDGDSDSTASIAGQIWGAWRDAVSLPHRWVRQLDVIEPGLSALIEFTKTDIPAEKLSVSPRM